MTPSDFNALFTILFFSTLYLFMNYLMYRDVEQRIIKFCLRNTKLINEVSTLNISVKSKVFTIREIYKNDLSSNTQI